MNGYKRSRLQRLQLWLTKFQRAIGNLLAPKWLRNLGRSLTKRLRKAESTVARTGQQVTKTMAKSSVGTGAKKLARSGRLLESRFAKFLVDGAKFTGMILSGLVPAPVKRFVNWLGSSLWRVFGVFFVFVGRWFRTRHYWQLLGGIPAFLLALPLAYCMIRMPFYGPDRKANHYRLAAQTALAEKEFATADLYYRKLQQLGAMNEVAEYQAAVNMFESGREAEGVAAMQRLGPETQPGFPYAHLWLARRYLNFPARDTQEENYALVSRHLEFALHRDPDNPEARAIRASFLQKIGKEDEALNELRQVVKQIPAQGLSLADLYARQGRWPAARAEVDKVLKIYEGKSANDVEMEDYEYEIWAYCYIFLGNLVRAETILLEAMEKHPGTKALSDNLYNLSLRAANADFRARRGPPRGPADRLRRAWRLRPDEKDALVLLGEMARAEDEFGQETRVIIDEILAEPEPPGLLCAVVGAVKSADNKLTEAIPLLRRALQHDPRDSYSLNNLAYCLMMSEPPQYDEALELINRALEIEPNELSYRETRGQLLAKMGRHADAIQDLEFVLNGMGDVAEVHLALANAYEKMGQAEQAEAHRRRAQ